MYSLRYFVPAVVLIAAILIGVGILYPEAGAATSFSSACGVKDSYKVFTFFTATTTTATSTNVSDGGNYLTVPCADEVLFYFSRGDTTGAGNSGSTIFKVQVTPDGANWYDYNELGQVGISSDANGYYTRVGTTTLPAGTSTQMFIMDDLEFYAVRCIAVKVTDGEATCKAAVNF